MYIPNAALIDIDPKHETFTLFYFIVLELKGKGTCLSVCLSVSATQPTDVWVVDVCIDGFLKAFRWVGG